MNGYGTREGRFCFALPPQAGFFDQLERWHLSHGFSEPGHSSEEEKTETVLVFEEHNGEHKMRTQNLDFSSLEKTMLSSSL